MTVELVPHTVQSGSWQPLQIALLFFVSGRELSGQLSMTWLPNDSPSSWTRGHPETERGRERVRLKMSGLEKEKERCRCRLVLHADQGEREREPELFRKDLVVMSWLDVWD